MRAEEAETSQSAQMERRVGGFSLYRKVIWSLGPLYLAERAGRGWQLRPPPLSVYQLQSAAGPPASCALQPLSTRAQP